MELKANYYDVLKVNPKASTNDIVTAYHKVKGIFSKDSLATYSLYELQDIQKELESIEEAYQVLVNDERRHRYDELLTRNIEDPSVEQELTQLATEATKPQTVPRSAQSTTPEVPNTSTDGTPEEPVLKQLSQVNGEELRKVREQLSMDLADVARITKIPSRFIKAIEQDELKDLPARVYVQGFVKILSAHYHLNAETTSKIYLKYYDEQVGQK